MAISDPAFGDVVVVPFPYSDRHAEKRRPALVVSGERLHRLGYLWVTMITSARQEPLRFDEAISDLQVAGLSVPSIVRPTKLACIEPERVIRRAGRLPADQMRSIVATLRGLIGPAAP